MTSYDEKRMINVSTILINRRKDTIKNSMRESVETYDHMPNFDCAAGKYLYRENRENYDSILAFNR